MKAPIAWFFYVNYPPRDGDWKASMRLLKTRLSEADRSEIERFLREAQTADESDLYEIECVEVNNSIFLQPDEGVSIRQYWAAQLRDFLK